MKLPTPTPQTSATVSASTSPRPTRMRASGRASVAGVLDGSQQIGRVRRIVWLLLALTIVAAVALPVADYCCIATSALTAHVCLWPATPRADAPARLLVILAPGRDSADAQTSQAQAQVQWDMRSMSMGAQHAKTNGSPSDNGVLVAPLWLNMAGDWHAHVSLQTPGRPEWSEQLNFVALAAEAPAHGGAVAGAPPVSQMLLRCQAEGTRA